jgi:hypothetical protein
MFHSVFAFASDITESMGHIIKEHFLRKSNRGGMNSCWTLQFLERHGIQFIMKCLDDPEALKLSPYERKKLEEMLVYFE